MSLTCNSSQDDATVKCWGYNGYGQLGQGDTSTEMGANLAAVDLGPGRTAVSVSAGRYHTCALLVSRCRARREQLENANAFALIMAHTKGIIWPRLAYLVDL